MRKLESTADRLVIVDTRPGAWPLFCGFFGAIALLCALWSLAHDGLSVAGDPVPIVVFVVVAALALPRAASSPWGYTYVFDRTTNAYTLESRRLFGRDVATGRLDSVECVEVRRITESCKYPRGAVRPYQNADYGYTVLLVRKRGVFDPDEGRVPLRPSWPAFPGRGAPEWEAASWVAAFLRLPTPTDLRRGPVWRTARAAF
jgi:hypothetical protein